MKGTVACGHIRTRTTRARAAHLSGGSGGFCCPAELAAQQTAGLLPWPMSSAPNSLAAPGNPTQKSTAAINPCLHVCGESVGSAPALLGLSSKLQPHELYDATLHTRSCIGMCCQRQPLAAALPPSPARPTGCWQRPPTTTTTSTQQTCRSNLLPAYTPAMHAVRMQTDEARTGDSVLCACDHTQCTGACMTATEPSHRCGRNGLWARACPCWLHQEAVVQQDHHEKDACMSLWHTPTALCSSRAARHAVLCCAEVTKVPATARAMHVCCTSVNGERHVKKQRQQVGSATPHQQCDWKTVGLSLTGWGSMRVMVKTKQ